MAPLRLVTVAPLLLIALPALAVPADGYRVPPADVIAIVDAPAPPGVIVAPDGSRVIITFAADVPTLAEVARPMLRLAGLRIDAGRNAGHGANTLTGLAVQSLTGPARLDLTLPEGARIGSPDWAPDSQRFSFTITTDEGQELWVADAATGRARRLLGPQLNATLGSPAEWWSGSARLLVRLVPAGRGAPPAAPAVPAGPIVQQTAGRTAMNRTYQDLLESPHDADLLDHYVTCQLAEVDLEGRVRNIGDPGMYLAVDPSPNGEFLRVERVLRPYSYAVPISLFASRTEVWDRNGVMVAVVDKHDVQDALPIGGVPTGPRAFTWQALVPATLLFVEALDGGDPRREVPQRDRLLRLEPPFDGLPAEVLRVEHRLARIAFADRPGDALLTESDRKRRWTRTTLVNLDRGGQPIVLEDRAQADRYGDPGRPVTRTRADGSRVVIVDDGAMYFDGAGASAEGERPFLDRRELASGAITRLFQSPLEAHTSFVAFAGGDYRKTALLIRRESPTEPPNYHLRAPDGTTTAITHYADPHPALTGIAKEVVTYTRNDGVPLSGTLYLPPGYQPGERLPLLIWAYPMEYNDPAVAGQVRSTANRFTRISPLSALMFVTQGYAVLDGAAMPVVGDPDTMNDTFLDQIVASAAAAIDAMTARGVCDPDRVAVGGHSYGAFMTANLLAHCDLFRAGVARSGAYNRSLTPFGFQSEERTLWQAPDVYVKLSPFFAADRINEPLLLIHGDDDNNSGTFPIQSQRLFSAMSGLGGHARYVRLPAESHGYRARESVLHVLAEQFDWLEQHVKHHKPNG